MASIDEVLQTVADAVTAAIAPFQPNLPGYPNTDPRAGQIPPTTCGGGHPIQFDVMTRLENKMASIGVYDTMVEKSVPFFNDREPISGSGGVVTYEVGRSQKGIIVEIWAYDHASRSKLTNIVRGVLGVALRVSQSDGTTTTLYYTNTVPFDMEQKDSVYIAQVHVMADYAVTFGYEGYPVVEADVGFTFAASDNGTLDVETTTTTTPLS